VERESNGENIISFSLEELNDSIKTLIQAEVKALASIIYVMNYL
jgi:hypothetical protein